MSVPRIHWKTPAYDYGGARAVAAALGLSHPVAAILARRGHRTVAEVEAFLAAAERYPASAFEGIGTACDTILGAIERGERVVVHGDYDVDGVCSTAILVRALRRLGADPRWYLPDRQGDGYGLSLATVERLAAGGARLLVTVDCGITSVAEVARARELGLEVVVTDHHRPAEALPDCPIVHPALSGYPFPDLCAAAVAHKLSEALFELAELDTGPLAEEMDLVALATVCDLVPLTGENRRLVRAGLVELARTRKPGLRALIRIASVDPAAGVTEHDAGFRLGPRLNAAGRLARADAALELLLTDDPDRATVIADELDLMNRERRDVETRILFEAEALRADQDARAAFVLASEDWHPGVIGIVASRIVERHGRPCVLVALDGEGRGRGSGRSVPAFDLHAGLTACSEHLRRFGGHRAAAGLEIDADHLPAFRDAFWHHAATALSPADLVPTQRVDAVVAGSALGLDLAEEIDRLGPFGMGNARPVLLVPAARIEDVRAMGAEGQHSRFTLGAGSARARAVAFRTSPGSLRAAGDVPHDVAFTLEVNEWKGSIEPRLVLRARAPATAGPCHVARPAHGFWQTVAGVLDADPPAAWRPAPEGAVRVSVDGRADGLAGTLGALLSSGDSVLALCASADRRRAGIEALLGARAEGRLALAAWEDLAAEPALAAAYPHLVAADPPPLPEAARLLETAPAPGGAGFCHLAYGQPEIDFTLQVAAAELDLRAALTSVYRLLRDAGGAEGDRLRALLEGDGAYRRSAFVCGRLLRILAELDLIELDARAKVVAMPVASRTELERSPTFVACLARLETTRAHLAKGAAQARAA